MEIRYSEKAVKQIKAIAKGDKKSAVMILAAVEAYAANPQGVFDVKVLKGSWERSKDSGWDNIVYYSTTTTE